MWLGEHREPLCVPCVAAPASKVMGLGHGCTTANKHEEFCFHEAVGDALEEATLACQMGGRILEQAL